MALTRFPFEPLSHQLCFCVDGALIFSFCSHKKERHRQTCLSVKYLMLHVRDCSGTISSGDLCPFPWCRKVKHLLYHLISCSKPNECRICRPRSLPKNLIKLAKLNFLQRQLARKNAAAENPVVLAGGKDAKETNSVAGAAIEISKKGSTLTTNSIAAKGNAVVAKGSIAKNSVVKGNPHVVRSSNAVKASVTNGIAGAKTTVKQPPKVTSSHIEVTVEKQTPPSMAQAIQSIPGVAKPTVTCKQKNLPLPKILIPATTVKPKVEHKATINASAVTSKSNVDKTTTRVIVSAADKKPKVGGEVKATVPTVVNPKSANCIKVPEKEPKEKNDSSSAKVGVNSERKVSSFAELKSSDFSGNLRAPTLVTSSSAAPSDNGGPRLSSPANVSSSEQISDS